MQCIACESVRHIDQLLLVEGIRRRDQTDERKYHGKERSHGFTPVKKR
jgi:hypothetical protein